MKLISDQNSKYCTLALAALLLTPCMLIAHPGDGDIHTLADGIQHFFSGWDHILLSALAGLLIASGRKLWSARSISAAICLPILFTGMHQVLLSPGNSQWLASIGLTAASMILLTLGSLAPKIHFIETNRGSHLRRIGVGFALLALALIQV